MSKSIGNVIDPLDSIAEFGTDALRFTLAVGTTPGQVGLHVAISPLSIVSFAIFTNGSRVVSWFLDLEPVVYPPQLGRKPVDSKRATQPQSLARASSCVLLSTSEKRHHGNQVASSYLCSELNRPIRVRIHFSLVSSSCQAARVEMACGRARLACFPAAGHMMRL